MNHTITWGELLRGGAVLAGIIIATGGVIVFLGGAFANPETGESDSDECHRGLKILAVGAVIVAAVLLTGCVSAPVQTKTVEVDVPVAVHPIKPSQIPPLPAQLGPRPSDARDGEAVALAGRCDAISFVIKAWPLLNVSAGLGAVQAPVYEECKKH